MIRVLHIMTDTNIGGAGIWVLNSVGAMSEEYEVYVALPRGAQLRSRLENVIAPSRIIDVDAIGDTSFSVAGYRALREVIKQLKPDIVHTHASLAGRLAAKLTGKSAIVNSRHCVEPVPSGVTGMVKQFINNRLSHKIIAVSEAIEQNLHDSGIKPEKVALLSNGVKPIEHLEPEAVKKARDAYNISETQLTVGFIGRLEEVKGPLFIPDIVAELKTITERPFKVIVAGDGRQKEALLASLEDKKLMDVVECIGLIEDVTEFYNTMDMVINTSRSEGIPMSLIEAMSIGLPIVTFDVGSLNQLVENECNGYLIKPFDTKAYAAQLKQLIEDHELRARFGERSRAIMFERFHVEQMNRQLEEIYREVIL